VFTGAQASSVIGEFSVTFSYEFNAPLETIGVLVNTE